MAYLKNFQHILICFKIFNIISVSGSLEFLTFLLGNSRHDHFEVANAQNKSSECHTRISKSESEELGNLDASLLDLTAETDSEFLKKAYLTVHNPSYQSLTLAQYALHRLDSEAI